jgi:DNA-binding NarL/FixJ family response regulator
MLPPFLLLEDSYSEVQLMTAMLKRIGLVNPVRVIGTVADARRHLEDAIPERRPVIVFVGAQTRGAHGIDLLEWMREQSADIGRIAAVALVDADDDHNTARALALGVPTVARPIDMRTLVTVMRGFGLAEKAKIDRTTLMVQIELWPPTSD